MVSKGRSHHNSVLYKNGLLHWINYLGPKWTELSKLLPGRPENMVKNRYNSFIKKLYIINGNEVTLNPNFKHL